MFLILSLSFVSASSRSVVETDLTHLGKSIPASSCHLCFCLNWDRLVLLGETGRAGPASPRLLELMECF